MELTLPFIKMKVLLLFSIFCCSIHFSFGQHPPEDYHKLIQLADSLLTIKDYEKAAQAYSDAFMTLGGKGSLEARYNAAAAWAQSGDNDSAFNNLERIITKLKFDNFEKIGSDPSFKNLHQDRRWPEILFKIAENKSINEADVELVTPQEIVDYAFQQSQVVMMNEAHSGLKRNIRSRVIGQLILPTAHSQGVRHLAMEALEVDFALEANNTRKVPASETGYLAQPEMREFIQAALDLDWTLIPYEADFSKEPIFESSEQEINWREKEQAKNLSIALKNLPSGTKLLVWCGNSHHSKRVGTNMSENTKFFPMGYQFWQITNIEPFVIDQLETVDMAQTGDNSRFKKWAKYENLLKANFYGTLGFITKNKEAKIISLHNTLE